MLGSGSISTSRRWPPRPSPRRISRRWCRCGRGPTTQATRAASRAPSRLWWGRSSSTSLAAFPPRCCSPTSSGTHRTRGRLCSGLRLRVCAPQGFPKPPSSQARSSRLGCRRTRRRTRSTG
eukprot:Amastigsp_a345351_13.p4 type:complete len:121 gc:universal Amastigsp_a345351_13:1288-1650(+)